MKLEDQVCSLEYAKKLKELELKRKVCLYILNNPGLYKVTKY